MSATRARPAASGKWCATERQESAASVSASMIRSGMPSSCADPVDEILAVLRLAHRRGGHGRDPPDAAPLGDLAHAAQGLDGPRHRELVEAAGDSARPAASRGWSFTSSTTLKPALRVELRHQQPDRVGPDIDGAEPFAAARAPSDGRAAAKSSAASGVSWP